MSQSILIVGSGPAGLTLAIELARRGVRPRIIDRLLEPLPYCRAVAVAPRTLEVFEQMGVIVPMQQVCLPITAQRAIVVGQEPRETVSNFSDLPYAPCSIRESDTERVLGLQLRRLGITVERGVSLVRLEQKDDGVIVDLTSGGHTDRHYYSWVIGCDGARSAVRHAVGIGFEGNALDAEFMLGEVNITPPLPRGVALRAVKPEEGRLADQVMLVPLPEDHRYLITGTTGRKAGDGSAHGIHHDRRGPEIDELQRLTDRLLPEPITLSELGWTSYFRVSMRIAERYQVGRVLIAGDAAHVHSPVGGQGMNTGIQDAFNLGWKLALVAEGYAPAALVDSYDAERRPVGEAVVNRNRTVVENLGRPPARPPHRLIDTQVLVNYRGGPLGRDDGPPGDNEPGEGPPRVGDRAPDARGLRRYGVNHKLRLFEFFQPEFMLLVAVGGDIGPTGEAARQLGARFGDLLRVVAVADELIVPPHGLVLVTDTEGDFARAYGEGPGFAWLVRPDGYILWRGPLAASAVEDVLSGILSV